MMITKEYEQLTEAEWLHKSEASKDINKEVYDLGYYHGYHKAIDDLTKKLLANAPRNYEGQLEFDGAVRYLSANKVCKDAKQLKDVIKCAGLQYSGDTCITEEIDR